MRSQGGSAAARQGTQLVVGPWLHIPWARTVGQVDFGADAANPIDDLQLAWFDHWLKGRANGVDKRPRVRIFVRIVVAGSFYRCASRIPMNMLIRRPVASR